MNRSYRLLPIFQNLRLIFSLLGYTYQRRYKIRQILRFFLVFSLLLIFAIAGLSQNVGIETTETIEIGGIKQVIYIKGKDSAKPLLLYLHGAGGNASSVISKAEKLSSKLQEHFVVVLWDQRDFGRTYELNKSPQSVTFKLRLNDTKEVIDYLLKKFGRKKLYLVGHSMGSALGINIANKYPELLSALIEISPPVNGLESQKLAIENLKRYFRKIKNERAVKELSTIKLPTKDFEPLFTQYKWQTEFDGEKLTDQQWEEARPLLKKALETSGKLYDEIYEMNFFKQFPVLKCPVYFLTGRKDFSTNSTLTEKFYKKLKAPKKRFFWFEKSAHNLPDSEPDLMQEIIIKNILPETL